MSEMVIGTVSDFFARPLVAGVELSAPLKVGRHDSCQGTYHRYHNDC